MNYPNIKKEIHADYIVSNDEAARTFKVICAITANIDFSIIRHDNIITISKTFFTQEFIFRSYSENDDERLKEDKLYDAKSTAYNIATTRIEKEIPIEIKNNTNIKTLFTEKEKKELLKAYYDSFS